MHPAPAGQGEPVLVYRPGAGEQLAVGSEQLAVSPALADRPSPTANSQPPPGNSSTPPSANSQPPTAHSTLTPLPEVVAAALPSLHCSTGTAARIDRDDDVTLHLAFFEWDLTSSTSVLEAFKHLPEECMGSIGMTLIEKAPARTYVVGGNELEMRDQGLEIRDQGLGMKDQRSEIRDQEEATAQSTSSNSTSNIQSSKFATQSLSFDHTVFRDTRGVVVHAFKGTWVSGATALLGEGVRGGVEQWNLIRRNAAFKRFRPAHARVVQGAVRGIPDPDLAWEAFEQAMLKDLSFQ